MSEQSNLALSLHEKVVRQIGAAMTTPLPAFAPRRS